MAQSPSRDRGGALPLPEIEPDLARAATLPSAWYLDPSALAREREAVFGRTWQLAARLDELRSPGDFVTTDVAGEPVLVVRGAERLRAMSAVCRHRAGPVASGSGNRRSFRCGYHGWTYDLEGRLLAAPEFEGVVGIDRDKVRLPEFRLENWGPFAFVNLDDDAVPLAEWMKEIVARAAAFQLGNLHRAEGREYLVHCNWKVYVDNYLEGYHIPIVHPALFRELDYARYRVEAYDSACAQIAPMRRGGEGRQYADPAEQEKGAAYFWVFPNLMLSLYPDNLQVNLVRPEGHERTRVLFEWYVAGGGERRLLSALELAEQVQREDAAICEAVQRGLASRTYDRGRYSVARENGVHHFHRLLARFLALSTD